MSAQPLAPIDVACPEACQFPPGRDALTTDRPLWMSDAQAAELARLAEGVTDLFLYEDPEIPEVEFLERLAAAERPAWAVTAAQGPDVPAEALAAFALEDLVQVLTLLRAAAVGRFHAHQRARSAS